MHQFKQILLEDEKALECADIQESDALRKIEFLNLKGSNFENLNAVMFPDKKDRLNVAKWTSCWEDRCNENATTIEIDSDSDSNGSTSENDKQSDDCADAGSDCGFNSDVDIRELCYAMRKPVTGKHK